MTHGIGGADAILPFIARRRIKKTSPRIKKSGRKTIANRSSSNPGPAQSTRAMGLSCCWGSPQPEGQEQEQEGSCRAVCRWHSPGMKSCQVWQHQSTAHVSCIPSPQCKTNISALGWGKVQFSYCVRKPDPKIFLVRQLFCSAHLPSGAPWSWKTELMLSP